MKQATHDLSTKPKHVHMRCTYLSHQWSNLNYQLDWFLHLWQCMADLEVALAANSAIVNDVLDMLCLHTQ